MIWHVSKAWPQLPYVEWEPTCTTLHLCCQVVGKIRLALAPMACHWWQVPLYVSCRGLTTSPIPWGAGRLQIDFDFIDHRLLILTSNGQTVSFPLRTRPVAEFYREVMDRLRSLGVDVHIRTLPAEIPDAIPFEQDRLHSAYEPEQANRFWYALLQADRLLSQFRCRFMGKASPVHFFWGSFDLAASRFSGRTAPPHPGGVPNFPDWAAREAYSHEVYSSGFWPGNGGFGQAAFYAYAYPQPAGFADRRIDGPGHYDASLGEFILPYEAVRTAVDPDAMVVEFLQATYAAAADLGQWDRQSLERQ